MSWQIPSRCPSGWGKTLLSTRKFECYEPVAINRKLPSGKLNPSFRSPLISSRGGSAFGGKGGWEGLIPPRRNQITWQLLTNNHYNSRLTELPTPPHWIPSTLIFNAIYVLIECHPPLRKNSLFRLPSQIRCRVFPNNFDIIHAGCIIIQTPRRRTSPSFIIVSGQVLYEE